MCGLPAFNVSALVLSFHGYEYEILALLNSLCRNSKLYAQRDSSILRGFLISLNPRIENILSFGLRSKSWNFAYPESTQLPGIARKARKRRIKLRAIKIKDKTDLTKGLQLLFTNGFETPMHERSDSSSQAAEEAIEVDTEKTIKMVSMCINLRDLRLCGLRLIDT